MRIPTTPSSGHAPTEDTRPGTPPDGPAGASSANAGTRIETPSGVISFPPNMPLSEAQAQAIRAAFSEIVTPVTYEGIIFSRELGRGVTLTTAPQHTKLSLAVFIAPTVEIRETSPGHLLFADQVEYVITGYDPGDTTLTLELVKDYRPMAEPVQRAEPTDDLDITPYLVVHRYRTDQGDWAWSWRCWGDGTCDGWLALDLSNRAYAERNARGHFAEAHAASKPTTP